MKKRSKIGLLLVLLSICGITAIAINYSSRRSQFNCVKEEYLLSKGFEQTKILIDNYFFEHGWYPETLKQVDTIFNHEIRINDWNAIRKNPNRFMIDPFSGTYYRYIPRYDTGIEMPVGYYLLSAGIDSQFDSEEKFDQAKIYDSVRFDYLSSFFGKKDLLFSQGSINDWHGAGANIDVSLEWLASRFDPSGKIPLPRSVRFNGIVKKVDRKSVLVKDTRSGVLGICYYAPQVTIPGFSLGDTLEIRGIYNKAIIEADTTFVFLNCVPLKE